MDPNPSFADLALCRLAPASALPRRMAVGADADGRLVVEPSADPAWWVRLADRVAVGFDGATAELCHVDAWAAVESATRAAWPFPAPARTGALTAVVRGTKGAIHDVADAPDWFDPTTQVWWAGDLDAVSTWVRVAPAVEIGCVPDDGDLVHARAVALHLGQRPATARRPRATFRRPTSSGRSDR